MGALCRRRLPAFPRSVRRFKSGTGSPASVDDKWRAIKLLETLFTAEGVDTAVARSMTAPLAGLNDLRIASAHGGRIGWKVAFDLIADGKEPSTTREAWAVTVDCVAQAFDRVTEQLRS